MVSVKWSNDALTDLDHIDALIRVRILTKISWFEENFTTIMPERLHHDLRDLFKLRIGDYRVIYTIKKDTLTIEAVGHRRDIYK